MVCRLVRFPALDQEEGETVVRAGEVWVEMQRPPIMANRLVGLAGLGEGNRHVLQDPGILGIVPQAEAVRGDGGAIVTLPLECEGLIEIIQTLRAGRLRAELLEESLQNAHRSRRVSRLKVSAPGS